MTLTYDEALKRIAEINKRICELREERVELLQIITAAEGLQIQAQKRRGVGRPRHAPGTMTHFIVDTFTEGPDVIWTAEMIAVVLPKPSPRQSIYNTLNRLKNSGDITQVGRGEYQANPRPRLSR